MYGGKSMTAPNNEQEVKRKTESRPSAASKVPSLVEQLYGPQPTNGELSNQERLTTGKLTPPPEPTEQSSSSSVIRSERAGATETRRRGIRTVNKSSVPESLGALERSATAKKQVKFETSLKYPAERYLPPPGPYFDQFSVNSIVGVEKRKCWYCWNPRRVCGETKRCVLACKLCAKKDHNDKACPLLYCTLAWFKATKTPIDGRQLRPEPEEFLVLCKLGLFLDGNHTSPLLPNTSNEAVTKFYKDKDAPRIMAKQMSSPKTLQEPNVGRNMLAKPESELTSAKTPKYAPATMTATTTSALDGHQHLRKVNQASNANAPTDVEMTDCTNGYEMTIVLPSKRAATEDVIDDMEVKLRELEDEVLKLKHGSIEKDREIRTLKSEIQQLHGAQYAAGNKRPCF